MGRLPFAIAAFALGASASALSAEEGFWTASSIFTPIGGDSCMREYTCGAPLSVYYNGGRTVLTTAPMVMFGACSLGDEKPPVNTPLRPRSARGLAPSPPPPPACNVCMTNPPTNRCEWRIVKRF